MDLVSIIDSNEGKYCA